MRAAPLKLLIVEDDELFSLGLHMCLQQEADLEIVAEAEDGETAVEMARSHVLDVVVLDIGLPGIGGIAACQQIHQLYPQLAILVLTSRTQPTLIPRLIEAGARGYCLKGCPAETLLLAIRSVALGASWWDASATCEIRAAIEIQPKVVQTNPPTNPLTRREQEILALIASGKTNSEIAQLLYIAPGTVRVHVHTILQKLEVQDRTQAAVLAIQKQLIAKDLLSEP